MAHGIGRPDINKALEADGNLEKIAGEATLQRRLSEDALVAQVEAKDAADQHAETLAELLKKAIRAVILGTTEGGLYERAVTIDHEGHLEVNVAGPRGAFGEVLVAEPVPVAQMDFVYGIIAQNTSSTVAGSGTATATAPLALASTTAAISSSAIIYSKRFAKYRPGQGVVGRFTALFTAGKVGSKQHAGVGTPALTDGFFFGLSGEAFGIFHINDTAETFIPQAAWNLDLMDGQGGKDNPSGQKLVPTNGNVYQIKYQYLGFGAVSFYVESSLTGQFVLVHIIRYANTAIVTHVAQPSFSVVFKAANTTNDSNIVVKTASGALLMEGPEALTGPRFGLDNNKATITTETNIITIKNCTTLNGETNRAKIRLRTLSLGSNSGGATTGVVTLKAVLNTTLGGSPSYSTVDGTTADEGVTITSGNSCASRDTAGTTLTGGTTIYNAVTNEGGNSIMDVTALDLVINPGEILTLSGKSTASTTVGIGVSWSEEI